MAWMGRAAALAAALLLSACVVPPPAGPSVGALPPKGKDAAQFQQDDLACRQYASEMLGGAQYSAVSQQPQYDQNYAQCMSAHGNIAPVATAGAPSYAYPYYAYPYYYPYAYAYPYYPYPYPWYWGGFGTSFVFVGHGHRHGGHFHGGHSGPRH